MQHGRCSTCVRPRRIRFAVVRGAGGGDTSGVTRVLDAGTVYGLYPLRRWVEGPFRRARRAGGYYIVTSYIDSYIGYRYARALLLGTHTRTEARSPDVATPGLRLGGRGACPRPPARSASRARPVAARPRAGPRVGRKNVVTRHSLQQAAASSSSGARTNASKSTQRANGANHNAPTHANKTENGLRTRHRRDPAVHEQGRVPRRERRAGGRRGEARGRPLNGWKRDSCSQPDTPVHSRTRPRCRPCTTLTTLTTRVRSHVVVHRCQSKDRTRQSAFMPK